MRGWALLIALGAAAPATAPCQSWIPLQWTERGRGWLSVDYDEAGLRRDPGGVVVMLRRAPLTAARLDPGREPGPDRWTRQEVAIDCLGETIRVLRWESRDPDGRLLASGGTLRLEPIRGQGMARALHFRLCPLR